MGKSAKWFGLTHLLKQIIYHKISNRQNKSWKCLWIKLYILYTFQKYLQNYQKCSMSLIGNGWVRNFFIVNTGIYLAHLHRWIPFEEGEKNNNFLRIFKFWYIFFVLALQTFTMWDFCLKIASMKFSIFIPLERSLLELSVK